MHPINGYGIVSEWLGSGLQNRLQRFESARCLRKKDSNSLSFFCWVLFANLRLKEGIPYSSKIFTPLDFIGFTFYFKKSFRFIGHKTLCPYVSIFTSFFFISSSLYFILVFDESPLCCDFPFLLSNTLSLFFYFSITYN